MATGEDLLDHVGDLVPNLNLGSGEADEDRGFRCLNRAQDLLELAIANLPTTQRFHLGTFTDEATVANQNYIAMPTDPHLLTLERVQLLDDDSDVRYTLAKSPYVGDVQQQGDPIYDYFAAAGASPGAPREYLAYMNRIWLYPEPDQVYTLRLWGLGRADDITRGGTFAYDDELIWPLTSVAARVFKFRVDDDPSEIVNFAMATFGPVLAQWSRRHRDGPAPIRFHNS